MKKILNTMYFPLFNRLRFTKGLTTAFIILFCIFLICFKTLRFYLFPTMTYELSKLHVYLVAAISVLIFIICPKIRQIFIYNKPIILIFFLLILQISFSLIWDSQINLKEFIFNLFIPFSFLAIGIHIAQKLPPKRLESFFFIIFIFISLINLFNIIQINKYKINYIKNNLLLIYPDIFFDGDWISNFGLSLIRLPGISGSPHATATFTGAILLFSVRSYKFNGNNLLPSISLYLSVLATLFLFSGQCFLAIALCVCLTTTYLTNIRKIIVIIFCLFIILFIRRYTNLKEFFDMLGFFNIDPSYISNKLIFNLVIGNLNHLEGKFILSEIAVIRWLQSFGIFYSLIVIVWGLALCYIVKGKFKTSNYAVFCLCLFLGSIHYESIHVYPNNIFFFIFSGIILNEISTKHI